MYTPRLKIKYQQEIIPALMKALNYRSAMQVPRLEKICLNQGLGKAVSNPKLLETALQELTLIAGQKAVPTRAKQAISNFKLREGMPIGARVTLRAERMYEFLDRLITISLPRVRDFRGVSTKGFDAQGNYTLGIKEQIIYPELSIDKVNTFLGMNITFVFKRSHPVKDDTYLWLKAIGMPFQQT